MNCSAYLAVCAISFSIPLLHANSVEAQIPTWSRTLSARNSSGISFINTTREPLSLSVEAEGIWSGGGDNPDHGAGGSNRGAKHPQNLPCPTCKNGSLIGLVQLASQLQVVQRFGVSGASRFYDIGGSNDDIQLFPGEGIVFKMNDYGWENNTGSMEIRIYQRGPTVPPSF